MKIKSERFKSIYIISCEGPALTPSSAIVFLTAMRPMIEKGRLDIVFDLENVQFVVGAQVEAIYRSVETIEGGGQLFFCGINERDFKLLKITHPEMTEKHVRPTDRNEVLSTLYWEKSDAPELVLPDEPQSEEEKELILGESECVELDISEAEIVILGEERAAPTAPKMQRDTVGVDKLKAEDKTAKPDELLEERDRRRFARLKSRQILNGDFHVFAKSKISGKHFVGDVKNIGLGGLLMSLSPPKVAENEVLSLEGRIGRNFKFKEEALLHSQRGGVYVFEFIDLSIPTTRFMESLLASRNINISECR